VAQLQKTPEDSEVRKAIFKVAAGLKSLPALPDEALRHEGRGNAAFKNAKDVEGFIAAAREFEAASLIAPWVPGYYSDMCSAYLKGGALAEARRSCWLYSLALTDEKEVREAKLRYAEVEYEAQRFWSSELQKLDNNKKPFGVVDGLPPGKRYFCNNNHNQSGKDVFRLGPNGLAPSGRQEIWIVRSGDKATVIVVFWVSAESFSELMKADVVIKNPLIKQFPAKLEVNDAKHIIFSTDLLEASTIEFMPDGSLGVTYRFAGFGRLPNLNGACEPID